jgi:hypothetical protein
MSGMPFFRLRVRLEEECVFGFRSYISRGVWRENEPLEEQARVREMPRRRADIRNARAEVLDPEGLAQPLCVFPNAPIRPG